MDFLKTATPAWVAVVLALLVCPTGHAAMCKWTDENGTVHYAEECPEGLANERVEIQAAPEPQPGSQPYSGKKPKQKQQLSAEDTSRKRKSSPAQLAAECERAREARLKPEREKLIKDCIAKGDQDASYCRNYYANYGDGGRQGGRKVPRMYDNLPECVAARQAQDQP